MVRESKQNKKNALSANQYASATIRAVS